MLKFSSIFHKISQNLYFVEIQILDLPMSK